MASRQEMLFYSRFDSPESLFGKKTFWQLRRELQSDSQRRTAFLRDNLPDCSSHLGFKVRSYRSGECTGAQYLTGAQYKVIPPARTGEVETTTFTRASRVKIRRAAECSQRLLKFFCTLTFSPSHLRPWELDEGGAVRHDFAKYKLKKFLNTCAVKQKRLNRVLSYMWVAELQDNGNIHFHILWDQFFDIKWLSKVWNQANNSVDIEKMNDSLHAAYYVQKYTTKDANNGAIKGNRYFISGELRSRMKPIENILFECSAEDLQESHEALDEIHENLRLIKDGIESRGGQVFGYGFSIPRPRSSKEYTDKKTGERKKTKAVDPRLSRRVLKFISPVYESSPF